MRVLSLLVMSTLSLTTVHAGVVLYGGNGGHPNPDGSPLSVNNGWLDIIDQTTGAVTSVGHPAGVSKLSGLAFLSSDILFASTINGNNGFPPPLPNAPTSDLVQINPVTGALIKDIGLITAGGKSLQIADLAIQPGTGILFGFSASSSGDFSAAGNLYTINKTTGAATLVGATGDFFGAIAFAPNGTLYLNSADLDNMGNIVNTQLKTLNPTNAQTLTAVATSDPPGALGVRSDGTIFAGNGDAGKIYTINPITGQETTVGNTGLNFVGDLDFQPAPEPVTLTMCGLGLLGLGLSGRRRRQPR
jgi:MYXO-CTERM domain-containing protein